MSPQQTDSAPPQVPPPVRQPPPATAPAPQPRAEHFPARYLSRVLVQSGSDQATDLPTSAPPASVARLEGAQARSAPRLPVLASQVAPQASAAAPAAAHDWVFPLWVRLATPTAA